MFKRLFEFLNGIIAFIFLFLSSGFWVAVLFLTALFEFLLPLKSWRKKLKHIIHYIPEKWVSTNNLAFSFLARTKVGIEMPEGLTRKEWYLVIANHQSWIDIVLLLKIFNKKISMMRFFMKKELVHIPFIGWACWLLDFPFMARHTKKYLEKYPEKKGKDSETTKKYCAKFKHMPVSAIIFPEGTRFTQAKRKRLNSPYEFLLRPKAGGMALILDSLGNSMQTILDVTIHYSQPEPTFWDFLCGRLKSVKIYVQEIPISKELLGDYENDPKFRIQFQNWLNELWKQKDQRLLEIKKLEDNSVTKNNHCYA